MPQKRPQLGTDDPIRVRILAAAVSCIERHGAAKTAMEDIARAAKVDRTTIYKRFPNRWALLDAVVEQRVDSIVARIKKSVDKAGSMEDAIVAGSLLSIRLLRKDTIFKSIIEASYDRSIESYFLDPASPMLKPTLAIWQQTFDRARTEGKLRPDLTDVGIATWLRSVHYVLLVRQDLTPKGQEALLREYVLPALSKS